jgi:hypothetical protein
MGRLRNVGVDVIFLFLLLLLRLLHWSLRLLLLFDLLGLVFLRGRLF